MIPAIILNQGIKLTEFQKDAPVVVEGKTFLNDKFKNKQEYLK
jgi:hypothetical protein